MPDVNETEFPPLPEYAANPFIAALPPIRTVQEIQRSFHCPPLLMEIDRKRPAEQRLHAVLRLLHYSQPTVTSRKVGLQIDQMMRQSYLGRDPSSTQWMRVANAFATREREESDKANRRARKGPVTADEVLGQLAPTKDTSMSCLVIGPPGMGKTHAARTTLAHYPQVIFHEAPIQVAQITWLRIECPPDGSLVSLCRFFFAARSRKSCTAASMPPMCCPTPPRALCCLCWPASLAAWATRTCGESRSMCSESGARPHAL